MAAWTSAYTATTTPSVQFVALIEHLVVDVMSGVLD
jgi:hypothetical protein